MHERNVGLGQMTYGAASVGLVDVASRGRTVLDRAREFFRENPDWSVFFREVLGPEGLARQFFDRPEEMKQFEQTAAYRELHQMVARLRARQTETPDDKEPTHMITVRIPKSLHEWLRMEAKERKTSMNRLCIAKLLQVMERLDEEESAAGTALDAGM
ncbi:MAG: toxin-antitoxin system HicB family antitoxin [Planctomycetota bacterium]